MSLKNRLSEEMKTAMREKNALVLSTIRLVNAGIKQVEVDERTEVDDARVVAIVSKMIKQRKESAKIYAEAGRDDLAQKENAEIAILQNYLPAMMSAQELEQAVAQAIAETGAQKMSDMGRVMALLKTRLAGVADMAEVNRILKAKLQ